VSPVAITLGDEARGPSDRTYDRLLVPVQQGFEVSHDTLSNVCVLDVVQD
jgi:hypothetical protein